MQQRFFLLTSFILLTFTTLAQNGSLRGNIFDAETGEPIIYCNLQLRGTSTGTTTDFEGFFTITNVPVGTYQLVATYIGCLLYTSPSPRDLSTSRMPSSA